MKNEVIARIKQEQIALAEKITDLKSKRKKTPNGCVDGLWRSSHEFRHKHIAYCELRGKAREVIEQPREGNEPDEKYIQKIKDGWEKELKEWRAKHPEITTGDLDGKDVCTAA